MKQISKNIFTNDIREMAHALAAYQGDRLSSDMKIGIVLEGGALRGVVSCGYARALAALLPALRFEPLYGSSSGALNSIYFATNQSELAQSIYVDNATDKQCTNLWRFPNILDVDWLVDTWMFGPKRFAYAEVVARANPIYIVVTDMITGKPRYFDATTLDEDRLRQVMKATSYAPILTNRTQSIDHQIYGDGVVGDAIPYERAIADGCTHIVCLLTRPHGYRKGRGNVVGNWFKASQLSSRSQLYREAYWASATDYNNTMERLYGNADKVPTLILSPADRSEYPGNIETRPTVIREMGNRAYAAAKNQLAEIFPSETPAFSR